jgi:hypothetical protein
LLTPLRACAATSPTKGYGLEHCGAGKVKLLGLFVKVRYLAMDGDFGHNQAVLMARAHGLHLISKLCKDAALYEKYEGAYSGRGAQKKYGPRVRPDLMKAK